MKSPLPQHKFSTKFDKSVIAFCLMIMANAGFAHGRDKEAIRYGTGLIVNVPSPEAEVEQVVEEVAQNTIIRGTKEYNKDEFVSGAIQVESTPVFPTWKEGGKVFYKVRQQAISPLNFKNSNDVGTLAVRYVLQPQGDKNTVLRIDAMFVEDFRHGVHASNGSVETSEYKDIADRLQAVELVKKETAEALLVKQQRATKKKLGLTDDSDEGISSSKSTQVPGSSPEEASAPPVTPTTNTGGDKVVAGRPGEQPEPAPSTTPAAETSSLEKDEATPATSSSVQPSIYEDLARMPIEQRVAYLRQQVSRLVKQPGAPLKTAPFHSASTLKSLDTGAEVLILIATPYWYGVETHEGQHGWLRRDQLEEAR